MSKSIKLLAVLGLVAGLAACAQPEPEVEVVAVEPISMEPEPTGKFQ